MKCHVAINIVLPLCGDLTTPISDARLSTKLQHLLNQVKLKFINFLKNGSNTYSLVLI